MRGDRVRSSIEQPRTLGRLSLPRLLFVPGTEAEAPFFLGAFAVLEEEAVEDFVFEGFVGAALGFGFGSETGPDGDVVPAVGGKGGAVEVEVDLAQLGDAEMGVQTYRLLHKLVKSPEKVYAYQTLECLPLLRDVRI